MSWAYDVSLACRFSTGLVFAVAVVAKAHSRAAWDSFRSWLTAMPLRPARMPGTPAALLSAEVAVVVLVALPAVAPAVAGLAGASVLSLVFTAGLYLAMRSGSRQPCHCFGASLEPLSGQHLARNGLLAAIALTGVVSSVGAAGGAASPAEAALAAIGGLSAALGVIFFADIAALVRPGIGGPAPVQRAGVR
jgi:hypothetical protein